MKKIAIFIPDLRGGGAERVFVNLANEMIKRGISVEFLLLQNRGDLLCELHKDIVVTSFNANKIRHGFFPLMKWLKNNNPDFLIAAMWPLTIISVVATKLSNVDTKLMVSDHNTLSKSTSSRSFIGKLGLSLSIKWLYPLADIRHSVSKGVKDDLIRFSGLNKSLSYHVIYNPVALNNINTPKNNKKRRIINVGSFKTQKNQILLVEAFYKLINLKSCFNVEMVILGEGPLRESIQNKIRELGVEDRVILPGFSNNVSDYYASSDLFVLSSDYEGFGNVIVEAMSTGLPIVSTDCESGPREILEDGKYGKLVPVGDANALAEAMYQSLNAEHDHEALKRRAKDFSVEKIAQQYLDVMFPEG